MKTCKLNYTSGPHTKMLYKDDENYTCKLYTNNVINKRDGWYSLIIKITGNVVRLCLH
jgi:hypothetical protein